MIRIIDECHSDNKCQVLLLRELISTEELETIKQQIKSTDPKFIKVRIPLFAKKGMARVLRKTIWFGPGDYVYSGSKNEPIPEPHSSLVALSQRLARKVSEMLGVQVELPAYLINIYDNGSNDIGAHADDEEVLGRYPTIVSLSIGATRTFVLKRMTELQRKNQCDKKGWDFVPNPKYKCEKHEIKLGHGDILIMVGATQEHFHHSVPAEKEIKEERINVTFRPHFTTNKRKRLE
jgi:alkylated DNA repair dioxygenase AlkB